MTFNVFRASTLAPAWTYPRGSGNPSRSWWFRHVEGAIRVEGVLDGVGSNAAHESGFGFQFVVHLIKENGENDLEKEFG